MSGTDDVEKREEALTALENVLDRQVSLDAITALARAVSDRPGGQVALDKVALGLDTNVFLRLTRHPNSTDILDYLPRHEAPLVLPGQTVQEFWNNRMSVFQSMSTVLKSRFDALAGEVEKIDDQFGDFQQQMTQLLDKFDVEFGYVYDENTKTRTAQMLQILQERAYCDFVPRFRFRGIAEQRRRTRTPPGFKDDNDGDFFVWADFLFGLLMCKTIEGHNNFERVILISNERKTDWCTNGTPHPVLAAEVAALFGVPFDLWNLDTFARQIKSFMA